MPRLASWVWLFSGSAAVFIVAAQPQTKHKYSVWKMLFDLEFLTIRRVCESCSDVFLALHFLTFDPGQSDLKSLKSASLSGVFLRKGCGGLSLRGPQACSSVAARPSSSFDYISNTASPGAALSSQNTMSQIKSNQIYSVSCFYKNKLATGCLVRRQKYISNPL